MKVCVIGLGYIGFPTACFLANAGHEVVGVDVSAKAIERIKRLDVDATEPGLKELAKKAVPKMKFSTKPVAADAFIICVPTPFNAKTKKADLKYVEAASKAIAPVVRDGNLVVLESTSPPGTTRDLVAPIVSKGKRIFVAHVPETVIPGSIIKEMTTNQRVVGGVDDESTEKAAALYASFVKACIHKTDSVVAEAAKLMENSFRDTNIALANEFAKIAEEAGFNVWEAIRLANTHPRVNIHQPGPGVGGHCIPLDPWFLAQVSNESKLIPLSREVNDSMPAYVAELVKVFVNGGKVAILGATYKPNVTDARESPTGYLAEALEHAGFDVAVTDPHAINYEGKLVPFDDAVSGASCIVLAVAHDAYSKLDWKAIAKKVKKRFVVDSKNFLDQRALIDAGFEYSVLGKGD
jgi:UDP-N-acetyl-D-mannosaminuronic acid dehydrogenase